MTDSFCISEQCDPLHSSIKLNMGIKRLSWIINTTLNILTICIWCIWHKSRDGWLGWSQKKRLISTSMFILHTHNTDNRSSVRHWQNLQHVDTWGIFGNRFVLPLFEVTFSSIKNYEHKYNSTMNDKTFHFCYRRISQTFYSFFISKQFQLLNRKKLNCLKWKCVQMCVCPSVCVEVQAADQYYQTESITTHNRYTAHYFLLLSVTIKQKPLVGCHKWSCGCPPLPLWSVGCRFRKSVCSGWHLAITGTTCRQTDRWWVSKFKWLIFWFFTVTSNMIPCKQDHVTGDEWNLYWRIYYIFSMRMRWRRNTLPLILR